MAYVKVGVVQVLNLYRLKWPYFCRCIQSYIKFIVNQQVEVADYVIDKSFAIGCDNELVACTFAHERTQRAKYITPFEDAVWERPPLQSEGIYCRSNHFVDAAFSISFFGYYDQPVFLRHLFLDPSCKFEILSLMWSRYLNKVWVQFDNFLHFRVQRWNNWNPWRYLANKAVDVICGYRPDDKVTFAAVNTFSRYSLNWCINYFQVDVNAFIAKVPYSGKYSGVEIHDIAAWRFAIRLQGQHERYVRFGFPITV